jgi:hypothetical protein
LAAIVFYFEVSYVYCLIAILNILKILIWYWRIEIFLWKLFLFTFLNYWLNLIPFLCLIFRQSRPKATLKRHSRIIFKDSSSFSTFFDRNVWWQRQIIKFKNLFGFFEWFSAFLYLRLSFGFLCILSYVLEKVCSGFLSK